MQTAAIPYRVADFLKQHPPFQFMEESDLVALAGRGRVKFHEPDEYICWQSSPHTPFIYVIQQGSVSLWDESTNPAALRDICGAGDSIGIERFNGAPASLHSAKASSEVVLYALHAADFEKLLARYPDAAHYVAAYAAVTADYKAAGERPQPHEIKLEDLAPHRAPVQCTPSTTIREAARLLIESGTQALAVTDGKLAGLLTADDLVGWIAAGAEDPHQPALSIASAATIAVPPGALVSDSVLAMAESRASAVAVTSDGSALGALQSVVTASSLAPAFGDHPVHILREIAFAPGLESLRALNERARAWILRSLTEPSALDWLAAFADLVNRRILERLVHLTGKRRSGLLWCFYGGAGRRELLTSVSPQIAVIGGEALSIESDLAECGYLSPEPVAGGSLDEWKVRFGGWIHDPIRTQVYSSRPFFDLRPVSGSEGPFRELEAHIRVELAAAPVFLRILANDCLADLPPLTFFRDLVIENSGEKNDTFRIESSALQPLVDVARVFSIASGNPLGDSTRSRFEQACRLLPSQETLFREAAETMRIVLFQQARAGLGLRSSGAALPLSMLSRRDRHALKTAFRSIHNLLEFTAPCDWLEER